MAGATLTIEYLEYIDKATLTMVWAILTMGEATLTIKYSGYVNKAALTIKYSNCVEKLIPTMEYDYI